MVEWWIATRYMVKISQMTPTLKQKKRSSMFPIREVEGLQLKPRLEGKPPTKGEVERMNRLRATLTG